MVVVTMNIANNSNNYSNTAYGFQKICMEKKFRGRRLDHGSRRQGSYISCMSSCKQEDAEGLGSEILVKSSLTHRLLERARAQAPHPPPGGVYSVGHTGCHVECGRRVA